MGMKQFLKDFYQFAMREKKWWLIPLIAIVLLAGVVLLLSAGSGISWALYPSN